MNIERHYDGTNFITGLRAIAVLMVFLIHSGGGGLREINYIFNNIVDYGRYGVEIFFVISGFTIYNQFLNAGYTPQKFLLVRFMRISLPYFALLIFLGILIMLGVYGGASYWLNYYSLDNITTTNYLSHFLYLGALNPEYANSIIGVEWTLNIEAFMYFIFFGIALLSVRVFTFKFTLLLFIFTACIHVFGILLSSNFFNLKIIDGISFHYSPIKWVCLFFLGGLAYHLRYKLMAHNLTRLVLLMSLIIYIIAITLPINAVVLTWVFSLIAFILIIGVKDNNNHAFILNNKIIVFLGSISFSFYLIHILVINYVGNNGFVDFILSLALTLIISFVWYLVFEKIIYTNLKKRVVR
jgi:peptidoglycan/LPS O-acetylase OafA/YrhL